MLRESGNWAGEHQLIDSACLSPGSVPADYPLTSGRLVFLWQVPTQATLAKIRHACPEVPILVGRFQVETEVYRAGMTYWAATDFLPWRRLIDFEIAGQEARTHWDGPSQPEYEGMPLIDGDLQRAGVWSELVACAAALLLLRRIAPETCVISDWMGATLAASLGFRTQRLWAADLADPNWPVRRWIREHLRRNPKPVCWQPESEMKSDPVVEERPFSSQETKHADVVFLLGGWVEARLLASFPIEALVAAGYRCSLWVHRRSAALQDLLLRTGTTCIEVAFPDPAPDVSYLQRAVGNWCEHAAPNRYFAPLRGELARCAVELMGWPRWTAKLVAMHRHITHLLEADRPALFIAPFEKDWAAYCGHHAARRLGIATLAVKHSIWLPGSQLERYDYGFCLPPSASSVLAYTPQDETLCRNAPGVRGDTVVWQGNLRLDKPCAPSNNGATLARILIAPCGVGPGVGMGLRKRVIPLNKRLITALHARLGDRVRVRLHNWDSPEHYPGELRGIFLEQGASLEQHLVEYDAVATTYSTISLDAAAAGRPVLLWDSDHLDLDRSEVAVHCGTVVTTNLEELCAAAERFVNDSDYRKSLTDRAARFPLYLRDRLPEKGTSMASNLQNYIASLARRTG